MNFIVMQVKPYIYIIFLYYVASYKMHRMWIHFQGMMTSIDFTTLGPRVVGPTPKALAVEVQIDNAGGTF